MELGIVGLGRMGGKMAERLLRAGIMVTGYARSAEKRQHLQSLGGRAADSLRALAEALPAPRAIWLMVPAGDTVDQMIEELLPHMTPGDILIDGGNSRYTDSIRRGKELKSKGYHFLDVGTSGGVWGLTEGYSIMIGGDPEPVERLRPIFEALAPAPDRGWGHVGPSGAGHFTKMIHNGIEYGMMQAFAEGFSIMHRKTEFNLDLHQVAEIWRYGSVVRSWLLDLTADALRENPTLAGIAPHVADSGEGRWTVAEAIDLDVPAPVISLSLIQRLRSRDQESFADRVLSAMRNKFGGHAMKRED